MNCVTIESLNRDLKNIIINGNWSVLGVKSNLDTSSSKPSTYKDRVEIFIPYDSANPNKSVLFGKLKNLESQINKVYQSDKYGNIVSFSQQSNGATIVVRANNKIVTALNEEYSNTNENYQLSSTEGKIASEKTIRDLTARMSNFDLFQNIDNTSPFEKLTYSDQQKLKKKIESVSEKQGDRIGIRNYDVYDSLIKANKHKEAAEYKKNSLFLYKIINNKDEKYKGVSRVSEGVIYINLAYATLDTPIHEILAHPIIRAIKNEFKGRNYKVGTKATFHGYGEPYRVTITKMNNEDSVEVVDENGNKDTHSLYELSDTTNNELYKNLLKELETGRGKEVLDRIKRDYVFKKEIPYMSSINKDTTLYYDKNTKTGYIHDNSNPNERKTFNSEQEVRDYLKLNDKYTLEEQQEEAIVELMSLMVAEKLDAVKDGKLISLLKRLLKEIKAFVRSLLSQREVEIDKLPDNMTLGDLSDLLAYSNSKLILPGNEVVYTIGDGLEFKTYAEINNHIKELARQASKYENVDLSKVEIDKEDAVLKKFLDSDKEYAQAREIIDTWKEVNNIQYNPEEAYSRGQEFIHVHNAYGSTDTRTWLQNLIPNLEDVNKANGVMEMSFLTYFQGKLPEHLTRNINEKAVIKIIAYPKSKDIAFASKIDNYTSSYSGELEGLQYFIDLSKVSKREQLAVNYTKSVRLSNINTIEPNIADTINDVAHHNEYAINIADGNFRIEYGEETPYDIKKLIDSINSILDQKALQEVENFINTLEKEC